jgi:hypothetical protein
MRDIETTKFSPLHYLQVLHGKINGIFRYLQLLNCAFMEADKV